MVAPLTDPASQPIPFEGCELQVAYFKGAQAAARAAQDLVADGNVAELQSRILRRLNALDPIEGVTRDDLPPMLRINHRGPVIPTH